MAKIIRPLFGDEAAGTVANILTFRTRSGKTETMLPGKSTKPPSAAQTIARNKYSTAHAAWMLLPKQQVHINKRFYWRRTPDWPTYYRAWPAPTAPSTLTATAISGTQINLSWQDNSDNEDGFKIERKTGSSGTWAQIATVGANITTYASTGLTASTTYYYQVRAYNVVGSSEFTNESNATTNAPAIPAAPSNLTATAATESRINLTWHDNSDNETGFGIERKTGSGGAWAQITTTGAGATTYANTGLTNNTLYYYRVRAYNNDGNSDYSGEASATTLAMNAPSNLTATVTSVATISLSWQNNSALATGTKIERKTGAGGSWVLFDTRAAGETTYVNNFLSANTTYYYRVRAYNSSNDSSYSNEANATTQHLAAPTNLIAAAISTSRIDISWQDNSANEAGFKIERKTGSGGTWAQITTVGTNVTSYSNTGLTANTTYYYRVRGTSNNDDSSYSNEANATTNTASCMSAISIGQTISDSFTSSCRAADWVDAWAKDFSFTISTGKNIKISVTASIGTYLYLYRGTSPGGTVVAEADGSGSPIGTATITKTISAGSYVIEVETYNAGSAGTFTVKLEQL